VKSWLAGQKSKAEVIGNAVRVMRIAMVEAEETKPEPISAAA
jgi:hypothetical protein